VDHIIWRLRQTPDAAGHYGPAWRTLADERDIVLGNGTYYVRNLNTDASGNDKSVDIQGWVPDRTSPDAVGAQLLVEINTGPAFDMAVLVKTTILTGGSFQTDSYNSTTSTAPGYVSLNHGHIGTLSTAANAINIDGNPYIHGTINYPAGATGVVKTPGAWWTQYTAIQGFSHPALTSVTVPAGAIEIKPVNDGPKVVNASGTAYSGPTGENYVQFVRTDNTVVNDYNNLGSDGLPIIPAGTYYIRANAASPKNSITIAGNRVMRFGPGVTKLYLEGNLSTSNSAKISSIDNKPTSVLIYGTSTCTSVSFSGAVPLIGGLYAPSANVVLGNGCAIYGSLVADRADLSGGGKVVYDEAFLTNINTNGGYTIKSWTQLK
jgi:hypothetical protein